jgi:hypothetical protein
VASGKYSITVTVREHRCNFQSRFFPNFATATVFGGVSDGSQPPPGG